MAETQPLSFEARTHNDRAAELFMPLDQSIQLVTNVMQGRVDSGSRLLPVSMRKTQVGGGVNMMPLDDYDRLDLVLPPKGRIKTARAEGGEI